jgi:hypothetical protein
MQEMVQEEQENWKGRMAMNERIKEIATAAGMVMYPTGIGISENTIWGDKNIERFAELLLEEACKELWSASDAVDVMEAFGFQFKPKFRKHDKPDRVDIMTVEEFNNCVEGGEITDYDGSGYWSTATERSGLSVWSTTQPAWATHVAWYNK